MSEKHVHDERERTDAEIQESKSSSEDEPDRELEPEVATSTDHCPLDQVEDDVGTSNPNPKRIKLSFDDKEVWVEEKRRVANVDSNPRSRARNDVVAPPRRASNLPSAFITIGRWKTVSKRKGDLIAKIYFGKKKLVWELLEGALLKKMEFSWSNIVGIRATFLEGNMPGVLEIELNKPPQFYRDDYQPRKRAEWQQVSDFTRGEAQCYRQHHLIFPPKVLNKHFEKLIQSDGRLYKLSKMSFPTQASPFFGPLQAPSIQQNAAESFNIPMISGQPLMITNPNASASTDGYVVYESNLNLEGHASAAENASNNDEQQNVGGSSSVHGQIASDKGVGNAAMQQLSVGQVQGGANVNIDPIIDEEGSRLDWRAIDELRHIWSP